MTDQDPKATLFQFFNEIGIIEQLARARLEAVLPHGLKVSQFSVLNHFVRLGGAWGPARLAKAFQVTKPSMTNTIQRLEALGFVDVGPDPEDGRGKSVTLTQAGREAHTAALKALGPNLETLLQDLSLGPFEDALPSLTKIRGYLDQNR